MKKMSLIIGKRQIILSCLTLMLGIAIYVNYALSQNGSELKPTSIIKGGGTDNYGDVQLVDQNNTNDFFAQARIDKMTARDQAVETLQTIFGGGDTNKDNLEVVAKDAAALSELIASESKIENLIKAAGFTDAVVYLDGETANVVVKSDGLIPSEAAQIKEILITEVDVDVENIRIRDVK